MSKLTIDECKQIISKGRKQLTAAEERIAELESLVKDMARDCMGCKFECYSENSSGGGYCGIFERVRNLTDCDAE